VRERESRRLVRRKSQKGRAELSDERETEREREGGRGAAVSVRARVCRAIIEFPPRNNEVLLTPTLAEVHPI